jgi:hypothetical protein
MDALNFGQNFRLRNANPGLPGDGGELVTVQGERYVVTGCCLELMDFRGDDVALLFETIAGLMAGIHVRANLGELPKRGEHGLIARAVVEDIQIFEAEQITVIMQPGFEQQNLVAKHHQAGDTRH